jgi:ABC-2 type transport system permease protein
MFGLAAIVNVAGTLFAAGVALRFRSLQATPLMMVPTFLLLFLAPVYVPRDLLGGWVHAVSGFDPVTHIMETGRELLAGQPADFLAALAIALGMVALLLVFALRGLRKAEAAG